MSVSDSKTEKKLAKKLSERYLKNSGEYYLNRFPASSMHFLTVMTRKIDKSCRDHPNQNKQEWIEHVKQITIPYFIKLGFLNDELYSQALFNSLKNRGFSAQKIKTKMIEKGVNQQIVKGFLDSDFNNNDAVILFAKKKKIGIYRIQPYKDLKEKNRDLGRLARAGFSYQLAISVFE